MVRGSIRRALTKAMSRKESLKSSSKRLPFKTRMKFKAKHLPKRMKGVLSDFKTIVKGPEREPFQRLAKAPTAKIRTLTNDQWAAVKDLQAAGRKSARAWTRTGGRAGRIAVGGAKAALVATAGLTGIHAAQKAWAVHNQKKRATRYDVYPEYGYRTVNTAPTRPGYREPYFNVYEEVLEDLLDSVE